MVGLHGVTCKAWGLVMLVIVRFLFGAGEAGALPNAARVLREWFPDTSRARAQGLVAAAMLLGGAARPGFAVADGPGRLAMDVRRLRDVRGRLGRRLLRVVPRRPGRASRDERGRAGLIAEGRKIPQGSGTVR